MRVFNYFFFSLFFILLLTGFLNKKADAGVFFSNDYGSIELTESGDINLNTSVDIKFSAGSNIKVSSIQNIELSSGDVLELGASTLEFNAPVMNTNGSGTVDLTFGLLRIN